MRLGGLTRRNCEENDAHLKKDETFDEKFHYRRRKVIKYKYRSANS